MTTATKPTNPPTAPDVTPRRRLMSPDEQLTVVAWPAPAIDATPDAIRTDSDDALMWYVPMVGTIGMVMAHRFARLAAEGPTTWTVGDIAATFGMGTSPARVEHTLERLERFAIATRQHALVGVRLWLPPLSFRQRCRLPGYLAAQYAARTIPGAAS